MENTWHLRRVADNASKACWICYKPTTNVLITPNKKDFFYICAGHLVDRTFCQPDADEAAAVEAKKKKDELDAEIEKVKKEFEEKQRLKREKRKGKEKEKDKAKEKEAQSKDEEEDKLDEKAKDDKIKELSKSKDQSQTDLGPRIFHLNKSFYQMRLDKLRNAEVAKRNRERLSNPANFPSPPSGNP
ncbi:VPS4-associated protein 1 [Paraphoma chrysanthemicola]|nr:VPS4-associated protein 1 [Paraphoma chrysanthemicola]